MESPGQISSPTNALSILFNCTNKVSINAGLNSFLIYCIAISGNSGNFDINS